MPGKAAYCVRRRLQGGVTTVFAQQSEELLDRGGAVRGVAFNLRGPTEGAGNAVMLTQPLAEVPVGPEVEGFVNGMHAERGLVAVQDGLQVQE